ncbi:MAG: IS110 family transposase [Isosphaeraceae bacterium]
MSTSSSLDCIGVGIDTAWYGHRVSFLRPDRQPAAKPLTVLENRAGYQALEERLKQLRERHPQAHFHVRIDAAGQYAVNLEQFLRGLDLPMTLSIGEPKRNKDYQKAHFPKRITDDTESQAMARFAVVELPAATPSPSTPMVLLREVAGRLQAQVKQTTQAINRLHNLLARAFPELATLTDDLAAGWVLRLLDKYPTAERIAQAHRATLEKIPYLPHEQAEALHQAAQRSVASLRGAVAEALVRELVTEVRHSQNAEKTLRQLLTSAFAALPRSPHVQVVTVSGIGEATAAVLVAKIVDIDRFATPAKLVNYFGVFPEENSSGVDKQGHPLPPGTLYMSRKGNDLVRGYLWNATRAAIRHNPAIRALYHRLKAKGKRGDVAIGHCMRKLLHLVFAVWKTDRPFDPKHFPWEVSADSPLSTTTPCDPATCAAPSANDRAVGHKQDLPAKRVVTTAASTVEATRPPVKPSMQPASVARPQVDFAFLRQHVTMEQILQYLDLMTHLRGRGEQRRGPCPVHSHPGDAERTFSVHLGKNAFQCFHAACAVKGNVLDLWAAIHRLPLYEAALHLAETFQLPRNREEEPVARTRRPRAATTPSGVATLPPGQRDRGDAQSRSHEDPSS